MEDHAVSACRPNISDIRRYPRYQVPLPATITAIDEETGESLIETISLRDVSLTGFYFNSVRAYEIGSHVEIQVALVEREYRLKALVQRSQADQEGPDSHYGIGVLFLRGGDVLPFIADLAAYLNWRPRSLLEDPAASEGAASTAPV